MSGDRASHPGEHDHATPRDQELPDQELDQLTLHGIGSWLNIAEIELSALTRQCLDRRIAGLDILNTELAAWQATTNADQRQVNWHFTASDARIKLRHLYPEL
jgi:hypothetical protein